LSLSQISYGWQTGQPMKQGSDARRANQSSFCINGAETFFQHATSIMLLEPRQLFDQRLHNICWSMSSTECGEIPSCPNPGISGEDTLSTCISST
jgi:hypothetical protein